MKAEFHEKNAKAQEEFEKNRSMIDEKISREFQIKVNEIKVKIFEAQRYAREENIEELRRSKYEYVNLITQSVLLLVYKN